MKKEKVSQKGITGNSRRSFLHHAGLVLGAVVLPLEVIRAREVPVEFGYSGTDDKNEKTRLEINMKQTGWNVYSSRYVYHPSWTWEPVDGAAAYIIQFAHQDDTKARFIKSDTPEYNMQKEWTDLPDGAIDMIAWAVDKKDNPICSAWRKRFYKSPGFDGKPQEPVNWKQSIDDAMTYLLAPARDKVEDFEGDMPRSCWSCCEESLSGQRRLIAFPALHHPSFVFAYLEYAQQFPGSKHTSVALKQARQYGDWLLKNRLPSDWRCGLFPYSTIEQGRAEGYIEGKNITLFRAGRVGEAMIALYKQFNDERYLDYARHIANVLAALQQADGSWPYRVNPRDGKVVEVYTSNAVSPARLFGLLENIQPNQKYKASRLKAIDWVMKNPVKTKLWQAMYEDVSVKTPYQNLEHWDTNEMIRYLTHYHSSDPSSVKIAEDLNHYIEDQFVVWQQGDKCIAEYCPTPTVLEQYTCYKPMESHTGTWIMSLMALHQATGKKDYLSKAINAANSIIRAQQKTGAYSTWGFDVRFERPLLTMDWPGCNAIAVFALLQLNKYVKSFTQVQKEMLPL